MLNVRKILVIAFFILLIGIIGSVLTYASANDKTDWETANQTIDPEQVQNLDIESNNAEIDIVLTNDKEIKIEYRAQIADERLHTEINDSTLFIQVKDRSKKWFNFGLFSPTKSLKVFVPEKDYKQLDVMNDNGPIYLSNLTIEQINLLTDNGRLTMDNLKASSIGAESDNGRIELKNVLSDQIEVKTSNGKVNFEDVEGDISGQSNNGSISLKTKHLNRSLDFETDNGKIMIQTEQEPTSAVFDLRVDNGKINVFGESNWNTIVGNGDHLIKLVTHNGGITIKK